MDPITYALLKNGGGGGGGTAADTTYDNTASGLAANNVQDAIDELARPYSIRRLGDYIYEIAFHTVPDAPAGDFVPGACSSYVQDGKLYRNLDWGYSELASFHVICPGFEGMAFIQGLTDTEQSDALLRQLPRRVVDGKNSHGIMCAAHIIYNDWDWHGSGSTPITELVYLILTNVKSMATISTDLADVLPDLCSVPALDALGYAAQFIVTDGTTTKAILPPATADGDFSIVDITDNPKLTNFRWVSSETVDRADLQTRPTGVERWNMMPCDLSDLRFTKAYEEATRLSEFIGIDGTDKDSTDAELEAIYDTAHAAYLDRERDGTTWQTMHSVVYSANGMEHLCVQENWSKDYIASGGGTAEDVTYDEEQDYSDGTVGKKLSSLSAEKVNKHEESYAGKVLGYDENGDAHPVDGGASAWNDVSDKPFDSVGDGLTTAGGVLKAVLVGESDTAFSFRIDENGHLILQSTDAALEIFDFYINEQGHLIIELEENNNG